MDLRAFYKEEEKYTYPQSSQIMGQTGCVGYLYGTVPQKGDALDTTWELKRDLGKPESFSKEFNGVMELLTPSILSSSEDLQKYTDNHDNCVFEDNGGTACGLYVESGEYSFLFRLNPTQHDYDFCCGCYVTEWLQRHIEKAKAGIRFINSKYDELFRIADGEKIRLRYSDGEEQERVCRYIDEYHTEVSNNLYHICQFAEIMERNGSEYAPAESEIKQQEEKEQGQEEKAEGTLELKTQFGTTENVTLTVNTYVDNNSLYVGMTTAGDGFPEPYGDVTVNLLSSVPPYCAFVDTNNMPELEDFLVKNGIAEFTGLTQKSGYCSYPLYQFNAEKMRRLCPDGMAAYEQENGLDKKPEKKEKSR